MSKTEFQLRGEMVLLTSLLKAVGLAATGGHAGLLVEEGEVKVNGEVESRKRRKLYKGDQVKVSEQLIIIV
jgi:ribosome-associated protein